MRKVLRVIFICLFTLFSFYYTDKVIYLSNMKDPLMIKINDYKQKYNISYTNAILTKDTMVVGSKGRKVNIQKSYENMKKTNEFNERLLEYESILPPFNKKNNLDKLITGKSTNEKNIAFIFEVNDMDKFNQIIYILNRNRVSATFFMDGYIIENNIENIKSNINSNISFGYYGYSNSYNSISLKYLKGIYVNNKIPISRYCLYKNNSFLKSCIYSKMNTIKPTRIDSNLYNYIKENKKSGYIYRIDSNSYNIKQLNSTIMYLKDKGYNLLSLDDLLKE